MATDRQGLREIRERLQELFLYDLYAFRSELKPLASLLYPLETINCVLAGFHEGRRKLLVVTYYRLIIITNTFGSPAQVTEIKRESVTHPSYVKRLCASSVSFEAEEQHYTFGFVSRRVLELFVWAVNQRHPTRG